MQPTLADLRPDRDAMHIRLLVGIIVMLVFTRVLLASSPLLLADPDIWWHVRTGEWIWQNGTWPMSDPFSYSFAGKPWIAKEWLSQILFAAAFWAAGWNGVMLISTAALALAAGAIYWSVSERLSPIYSAIASLVAVGLACSAFTVRPHLLSLVLAIVWTHLLFKASWEGRAPRLSWLLIIVVWANLHAIFTIGFVVAFFAFLDAVERTRFTRKDVLAKWLIFLALCPLVSMIHPYGWRAIWATWTIAGGNEAVPLISEWQPFNAQEAIVQELGLLALLLATLVSGFKLGLARALLIVLMLHMFLIHVRFAYIVFPLLPILVAPEIARQFPRISFAGWRVQPRDRIETFAIKSFRGILACLLALFAALGLLQFFVFAAAPPERVAISSAIHYAKANGLTGHVFNYYDFGGTLVFNGIPDFIDGRNDQLFLGGFTTKYMFGPDNVKDFADALATYDVSWTLLPPEDSRNALLDGMTGWKRAYSDEHAVIYVRQSK